MTVWEQATNCGDEDGGAFENRDWVKEGAFPPCLCSFHHLEFKLVHGILRLSLE